MKKQSLAAYEAKIEQAQIHDLMKLMLNRYKEQHGHSKAQGLIGSDCIKEHLSVNKLIRPQIIEEINQEFVNLYKFAKTPKKKPIPVPPTEINNAPNNQSDTKAPVPEAAKQNSQNDTNKSLDAKSVLDSVLNNVDFEVQKRRPSSERLGIMEKLKRLQEGGDVDDLLDEEVSLENILNSTKASISHENTKDSSEQLAQIPSRIPSVNGNSTNNNEDHQKKVGYCCTQ